jgi:hypothetical protein
VGRQMGEDVVDEFHREMSGWIHHAEGMLGSANLKL